jgi:hypothetical protein
MSTEQPTATDTVTGEKRLFVTTCWKERARNFSLETIREILIPMLGVLSAIRFGWPTGGSDGAWNDKSIALIRVRLVCGDRYREIKERNMLGTEKSVQIADTDQSALFVAR